MPVVIQELVVRVVVEPEDRPTRRPEHGAVAQEDRTTLVEAAVQETLKVLRRERER